MLLIFVVAATALYGPDRRLSGGAIPDPHPLHGHVPALQYRHRLGRRLRPFTAFAIVAATGNIYAGLWYPFAFTLISVLVCLFPCPETKGRSLDQ